MSETCWALIGRYPARWIAEFRSDSQTKVKAHPDAAKSQTDLSDDVPDGGFVVAAVAKRERVEAEARKRGESAEHPDEDERARQIAELKPAARHAAGQESNGHAPHDVDDERGPWHG